MSAAILVSLYHQALHFNEVFSCLHKSRIAVLRTLNPAYILTVLHVWKLGSSTAMYPVNCCKCTVNGKWREISADILVSFYNQALHFNKVFVSFRFLMNFVFLSIKYSLQI